MMIARVLASMLLWAGLCGLAGAAEPSDRGFDCSNPQVTVERDLCAADAAAAADIELNHVYAQARRSLHGMCIAGDRAQCDLAERSLVAAQRAWIAVRDHDCEAMLALHAYGSSRNYAQQHCLITHTRDRTRQLRDFYELI